MTLFQAACGALALLGTTYARRVIVRAGIALLDGALWILGGE